MKRHVHGSRIHSLIFAVSLASEFMPGTCYTLSSLRVQGTVPRDPVSCRMDKSVDKLKLLTGRFCNIGVHS